MAKKDTNLYLEILKDVRNKNFKPIYFLMGEESYFIDLITDAIIENALTDDERDFNQTIMYGADIDNYGTVVNAAKRYPMMAPRQLVVVKEAQQVANIELLSFYLKQPLASTILVINHKHGVVTFHRPICNRYIIVYSCQKSRVSLLLTGHFFRIPLNYLFI